MSRGIQYHVELIGGPYDGCDELVLAIYDGAGPPDRLWAFTCQRGCYCGDRDEGAAHTWIAWNENRPPDGAVYSLNEIAEPGADGRHTARYVRGDFEPIASRDTAEQLPETPGRVPALA